MTTDSVGGVWQYSLELARGLVECGDEVALATMGGALDREQRREAEAIPGLELYPSAYKLAWMEDPWTDVEHAGDWLQAVAAEVQPGVVHLNDYSHGALPWKAPVLMAGHSCVLSWWQAVHGAAAPPVEWTRYRGQVRRGLQSADFVVAPTQAMLAALEFHYGPLPPAQVIANGRAGPADAGSDSRRDPIILAAGRIWDAGKNIAALAAVAPRLSWPVHVAGAQRSPDGQEASFDNVTLLGRLPWEQLAQHLSRAAIYALPARYEPFGLSVLEAAQAGCALVLGDIDSLREVWGDAALYVAPDDHDALAEVLQRLIADPALRTDYAARARLRAARYTPAAMVQGYRRAYTEICRRRPGASIQPGGEVAVAGAAR